MSNIGYGISNFKDLINTQSVYIDKSLFIKEVVADFRQVVLITRPRRFGKTLNMSMLDYFFNINHADKNSILFKHLDISNHPEIIKAHQGKYPVIFLSLKQFERKTFKATIAAFKIYMSTIYEKFQYLLSSPNLTPANKDYIDSIINLKELNLELLQISLQFLTKFIYHHHGIKPILLIDEYDAPLHASILASPSYYDEMVDFMSIFLGTTLKGNEFLHTSIVTGILTAAHTSIFSGLNNIRVCDLTTTGYDSYFGFSESEVEQAFSLAKLEYNPPLIKKWYNGYLIGNQILYNPWSILCCIQEKGKIGPYWLDTGEYKLVGRAVEQHLRENSEVFFNLMRGEGINVDIDTRMILSDINDDIDAMWSLLLFTGYLKLIKYNAELGTQNYTIAIPNHEIQSAYQRWIKLWLGKFPGKAYSKMINYLQSYKEKDLQKALRTFIQEAVSYYDFNSETLEVTYHAFLIGVFSGLEHTHKVVSNREAGSGRFDLLLEPLSDKYNGYIIELKSEKNSDNLDASAEAALNQIKKNNYIAHFSHTKNTAIYGFGIAFSGKSISLKSEQLQ